ncbi:MAG: hypothetical protein HOO19_19390 [Rhodospirillaceae bacterium]|nr:hypothetical protein [Rhodospirillaceae bacterium]
MIFLRAPVLDRDPAAVNIDQLGLIPKVELLGDGVFGDPHHGDQLALGNAHRHFHAAGASAGFLTQIAEPLGQPPAQIENCKIFQQLIGMAKPHAHDLQQVEAKLGIPLQNLGEGGTLERQDLCRLQCGCVGRAGVTIDQRHFAEYITGHHRRKNNLVGGFGRRGYLNLALDDHHHFVGDVIALEDDLIGGEGFDQRVLRQRIKVRFGHMPKKKMLRKECPFLFLRKRQNQRPSITIFGDH